jgi:tetratricopeptide (TPR) repeat protein
MEKWNVSFRRVGLVLLCLLFHNMVSAQLVDCANSRVKDSLVMRYISNGAERSRVSYMDPKWQLYGDSILMVCSDVADAYQLKAIPFLKYGDMLNAMPLLDKAVLYDTLQFLPYRAFIKCIFAKDYAGAITDFEESKRHAGNAGVMDHTFALYLGLCYLETGKPSQAVKHFAEDVKTQQTRSGSTDAHFNSWLYQGIALLDLHQLDSAKASLAKCLAIYPQHPEGNYYMAIVHKSLGQPDDASRYMRAAISALKAGYSMNEDNLYYVYYPRQITLYEVEALLVSLSKE